MRSTPDPPARATIVARDVRGVVKTVELDAPLATATVDDVRRAVARAHGRPDRLARVCAVGRDGELRGAASWTRATDGATEAMVFGFARAKTTPRARARERRRRKREDAIATRRRRDRSSAARAMDFMKACAPRRTRGRRGARARREAGARRFDG